MITQRLLDGEGGWYIWTTVGNFHDYPFVPAADRLVFPVQIVGLQGEGHLVDERKGRELQVSGMYHSAATYSILMSAFAADDAVEATGELIIDSFSYGNATYLGANLLAQPRRDGVTGLFYAPVMLRWRLRN